VGKRLVKRGGKESARLLIIPILIVNLSIALIANFKLIPAIDSNPRFLLFIILVTLDHYFLSI